MDAEFETFRSARPTYDQTPMRQHGGKSTGRFLKGPIPLNWLQTAAQLPGKTPLIVALLVWHQAGLRRRRDDLMICANHVRGFGVGSRAARRALSALEAAGLIDIDRRPGQCPRVSIIDVDIERKP